jgi:hypothetical protein
VHVSQTASPCPRRGAENPEHARFCHACAAPLAADSDAEAAERWKTFGHRYEQAQALLGLACCLLRAGRSGAGDPLLESRRLLVELGAVPLSAEADDLLQEATAVSS